MIEKKNSQQNHNFSLYPPDSLSLSEGGGEADTLLERRGAAGSTDPILGKCLFVICFKIVQS